MFSLHVLFWDFIFESCTWSLEWILALWCSVLAAPYKLLRNCDLLYQQCFSLQEPPYVGQPVWQNKQHKLTISKFHVQNQHPPKHESWLRFVLEVWGVWRKETGQKRFCWLIGLSWETLAFDEHRGSTWKCALEDEKCLFFLWEATIWQARDSLGEMLPSAAASHCESDGIKTQYDGFASQRHEMLQNHQERHRSQLIVFSFFILKAAEWISC